LRRHSKTKRGAIGSPFCIFGVVKNYRPEVPEVIVGPCERSLLSLSLMRMTMRNLAVVMPTPRRMPVVVPVVR
jgi:hypothetical protein